MRIHGRALVHSGYCDWGMGNMLCNRFYVTGNLSIQCVFPSSILSVFTKLCDRGEDEEVRITGGLRRNYKK